MTRTLLVAVIGCSLLITASLLQAVGVAAFGVTSAPAAFFRRSTRHRQQKQQPTTPTSTCLFAAEPILKPIPADLEGVPIPFVDKVCNKFIECYADSTCIVDGVEYTIAVPCDYSVALCYTDKNDDQLIPIELSDEATMDDLFPVAEAIVAEEFGEDLVLQRTPQTLTLVGELEEDDDEEDEEDEDDDEDEDDEEEVEVLLSFDHRGKEFHLVRLLDPILLVGKEPPKGEEMDIRVLLSPEESDQVMPILEELLLKYHNDDDDGVSFGP